MGKAASKREGCRVQKKKQGNKKPAVRPESSSPPEKRTGQKAFTKDGVNKNRKERYRRDERVYSNTRQHKGK